MGLPARLKGPGSVGPVAPSAFRMIESIQKAVTNTLSGYQFILVIASEAKQSLYLDCRGCFARSQ